MAASTARHAGLGQLDDDAAAVVGVGAAADESAALEAVDPVGHGAAGDKRLLHELSGRELVGLAGPAQGGEHVELPPLEAVLREGLRAVEVEPPGQPRDAREDLQRGDVEVGALAVPGLDDPVDVVGSARAVGSWWTTLPSIKYLDIKIHWIL